ncbi:lipoprotein [Streptomyces sp. NPDC037389]|uniref:lipoprotein n=1 Tax=Streptomyces sp. NPDC037389 TaxID=3155369 RepID=UPI0033E27114
MRRIASGAVSALLTVGVLTGCSSTDDKSGAETSAGAMKESLKPAEPTTGATGRTAKPKSGAGLKDGRIGDAGTACALPVSFEAPKDWKLTEFTAEDRDFLRKLSGHASVNGACELSARPTGVIGFIRVFTTDGPDKSPRQALENFVAEEKRVSEPHYTETKLGDLPAAEVVYTQQDLLLDEPQTRRGLAVKTTKGLTVLHLEGAESDDSKVMIPAYEQAKATMRSTT